MEDTTKPTWVTASDAGNAAYCPYQLYLKKQGIKPSKKAVKRMASGTVAHVKYNHSHQPRRASGVALLIAAVLLLLIWLSLP